MYRQDNAQKVGVNDFKTLKGKLLFLTIKYIVFGIVSNLGYVAMIFQREACFCVPNWNFYQIYHFVRFMNFKREELFDKTPCLKLNNLAMSTKNYLGAFTKENFVMVNLEFPFVVIS